MNAITNTIPKRYLVAVGVILTACLVSLAVVTLEPAHAKRQWGPQYRGATSSRTLNSAVLTEDQGDTYTIKNHSGNLYMKADQGNERGNLRKVMWPNDIANRTNTQSCAVWLGSTHDRTQQGIALRIRNDNGRVRAITVTKNVIYGVYWVFNVHTWDSTSEKPFTQIGQFNMSDVMLNKIGGLEYMPWRVCARVVGDTFSFKVSFPQKMSNPSWTNASYAKSVKVPKDYVYSGQAGWYVGHIPPNGSTEYNGLATWRKMY